MSPLIRRILPRLALLTAIASLGGCSALGQLLPERTPEYQQAGVTRPLEVPPGLTAPPADTATALPSAPSSGSASQPAAGVSGAQAGPGASAGTGARAAPAPAPAQVDIPLQGIRVARAGTERWLVVDAPPARVWPRVREFWLKNGFLIRREDAPAGVLETNWAQYRPDIAEGPIRMVLNKVISGMYSAPIRSQYLVRVEPGGHPGTTDVYISQRGMHEVYDGETYIWQMNPPDPALEAAMLRRLMVFLGVPKGRAESLVRNAPPPPPQARIVHGAGGVVALDVDDSFDRAWSRTGIALDRIGFVVQNQSRAKGVYYVRYDDPLKEQERRGLLTRWFHWFGSDKPKDDHYWIRLSPAASGKTTRVVVLRDGGKPDDSRTAQRILTLLQEQLR